MRATILNDAHLLRRSWKSASIIIAELLLQDFFSKMTPVQIREMVSESVVRFLPESEGVSLCIEEPSRVILLHGSILGITSEDGDESGASSISFPILPFHILSRTTMEYYKKGNLKYELGTVILEVPQGADQFNDPIRKRMLDAIKSQRKAFASTRCFAPPKTKTKTNEVCPNAGIEEIDGESDDDEAGDTFDEFACPSRDFSLELTDLTLTFERRSSSRQHLPVLTTPRVTDLQTPCAKT